VNKSEFVAGGGMMFGDEGKGAMVDYWARKYNAALVVRYGGPQAAHNAVTPEGLHHTFAQYGSATLSGVETYLSEKMLVDPQRLLSETKVLSDKGVEYPLKRIVIDPECIVVTPFHERINRMREISRGKNKHGSCGVGVGEAAMDEGLLGNMAIRVKDFFDKKNLCHKLNFLWQLKIDMAEQLLAEDPSNEKLSDGLARLKRVGYVEALADAYVIFAKNSGVRVESGYLRKFENNSLVIFEGSQGVLLDKTHGFHPYVTKTTTTFEYADYLIDKYCTCVQTKKIGILRAYMTRHGAGPFITEDRSLTEKISDFHNGTNEWQDSFRVGWFDVFMARYALKIARPDLVALTNLDRLSGLEKIKICAAYEYTGPKNDALDKYFLWEKFSGNRIRVSALKKGGEQSSELSEMLFECRPLEFIELDGWQNDISGAKSFGNLPKQAQEYVSFLTSKEMLNIPFSSISVGPAWTDKIEL